MSLLAMILAAFLSAPFPNTSGAIYYLTFFNTLIISFFPITAGTLLTARFPQKNYWFLAGIYLPLLITVTLLGDWISRSMAPLFFDSSLLVMVAPITRVQWLPSILLSGFFGIPAYLWGTDLFKKNKKLVPEMDPELQTIGQTDDKYFFVFLQNRLEERVPLDEILYFSATGKKSILHTLQGEFALSEILGNIEKRLPAGGEGFLRIHRSYLVHKKWIRSLEHSGNGQYMVYLNDDEDTTLPVSRGQISSIKRIMRS